MALGAVSGALFGGAEYLGLGIGGATAAGAVSGAINAAVYGGNIFQSALIGAGAAGGSKGGVYAVGHTWEKAAVSVLTGGVVGGLSSVAMGGDFWQGFTQGAASAGLSFAANSIANNIQAHRNWMSDPRLRQLASSAVSAAGVEDSDSENYVTGAGEHARRSGNAFRFSGKASPGSSALILQGEDIPDPKASLSYVVEGAARYYAKQLSALGYDVEVTTDLGLHALKCYDLVAIVGHGVFDPDTHVFWGFKAITGYLTWGELAQSISTFISPSGYVYYLTCNSITALGISVNQTNVSTYGFSGNIFFSRYGGSFMRPGPVYAPPLANFYPILP
jgi:hypothetical protein